MKMKRNGLKKCEAQITFTSFIHVNLAFIYIIFNFTRYNIFIFHSRQISLSLPNKWEMIDASFVSSTHVCNSPFICTNSPLDLLLYARESCDSSCFGSARFELRKYRVI